MKQVEIITQLIDYLPKADIDIAKKFVSERKFDNLRELVNSDIVKIRHNLLTLTPKKEYLTLDVGKIRDLKKVVDAYCVNLGIDIEEEEFLDELYDDTY